MSKLIEFNTKSEFESFITTNSGLPFEEALGSSNNGVWGSVVLIKDTNEIYANNKLQLQSSGGSGNNQSNNYATKDDLNTKQDTLISGTNIKTINGNDILGEGNVVIGYKPLQTSTSNTMVLDPNVYYRNTNTSLTSLTITLNAEDNSSVLNEYLVEFTTRSTGTTINLPTSIVWANGETPTFETGTKYQISIVNNLGIITKFK